MLDAIATAEHRAGPRTAEPDADPVCDFYTRHPYPPPVPNLDRARDEWRDPNRHRAEHHLFWPHLSYRPDLNILVAGCGTWQAAKYALCRPAAKVVGIDVSTTSLEHTERLKQQYQLRNLEVQQLAVEDAGALNRRFDLVVCTGVLHHLADPDIGLRALRSVLNPEGAIYAMVYAPYGRTGIAMIQEYCRNLGIGTSPGELDDLIATLKTLPQHHPLTAVLRASRDAADPDALADALLNPRERSYSVEELFDFLERGGCTFGRWLTQAPYSPQCGAPATSPHATRLMKLPPRNRYAAMELWRGTLARHNVIAYRDDDNRLPQLDFDDERWRSYVPLRLPWTVCVQERLPAGAAAVLLNRSHPHPDLVLPVSTDEKRMFDAINGYRCVADIVEGAGGNHLWPYARALFERLWSYDQVVFDASHLQ
jgi:SAM-dependent methyltransferase